MVDTNILPLVTVAFHWSLEGQVGDTDGIRNSEPEI